MMRILFVFCKKNLSYNPILLVAHDGHTVYISTTKINIYKKNFNGTWESSIPRKIISVFFQSIF